MSKKIWMLPEGIEDYLGNRAYCIEKIREKLTSQLQKWGYQQVIPAMFESFDSLNVVSSEQLVEQSFKLTDPVSGKIIVLRTDMTTQVARIDARSNNSEIARFFYAGHIFRGKNKYFKNSRTPIQLGAEIYGHSGIESDIEITELMIHLLSHCGFSDLVLDISHAGCLKKLIESTRDNPQIDTEALIEAIKKKSIPDLDLILDKNSQLYANFYDLINLIGDESVLDKLENRFHNFDLEISQIKNLIQAIKTRVKNVNISWHIDLSNLKNFRYHSGLIFNVIDAKNKVFLAKGGRYDNIGKAFGISRPATGFSMFIDQLENFNTPNIKKIFIPLDALNHPHLNDKLKDIEKNHKPKGADIQFIRALNQNDTAKKNQCIAEITVKNNQIELIE